MKFCKNCGKKIRKDKTYCTIKCKVAYLGTRECKRCKVEFVPTQLTMRYCSDHCRESASNRRQAWKRHENMRPSDWGEVKGWKSYKCVQCNDRVYSVDDTPRKCYICR